jgi:hypothetical protein
MKEEAVHELATYLLVLPVMILALAAVAVIGDRFITALGGTGPNVSALATLLGL